MKKHILFILLSIFSLESIHAEIEWTLSDDGTLTISGTDMPNYYYRGPWDNEQDNIKKVIIEKGVTNIGDHAFYGFPFLTSVSIPNTVTTIGDHAFRNCPSLSSVSIGNSVTSIGDDAFNGCSSLTSISIPNSVVSIGNAAFISCTSLTYINIPNSVTSIGNYAFCYCSSLTTANIPNSVTAIAYCAFDGCSSLTTINLPNSVTSIGDYAFHNCISLTSISIPYHVTSIGKWAFYGCKALSKLTCNALIPPYVGKEVFHGTKCESGVLYVPASAVDSYKTTGIWRNWKNIQSIENSYIVMLDHNGGKGETEHITAFYDEPMPENIGLEIPTRTGYKFTGYSINEIFYYDENLKSVHNFDQRKDLTLYANWKARNTMVILDSQGGNGGTPQVTAIYEKTMPIGDNITPPTRAGYIFDGYYSSIDGKGTKYYNADMTSDCYWYIDTEKSTIYANWIVIPVTDITISDVILSLWADETKSLTATATPSTANNTAVEWSSSDNNVATVSAEGLITAKGQGTCTITCTAADGYGTTSICEVSVKQQVTSIALSETTTSLWVGDTKTITAKATPTTASNTAVEWSSSDDNVVSVSSEGVITAKGQGTCIISCTAADGYGTKSTCEVTIKQQVTEIALNETTTSLWVGDTKTITATSSPTTASNTSVSWSSSDDKVAIVSSKGIITAKGKGTCTITCTAADGYGTKSTCEVAVKQQVTSIILSDATASLWVGKTKTLTATISPTTANNTAINWSSSDNSVATVSSKGVITAKGKGTCTITCTAADGYGTKSTCKVTVKQQVNSIDFGYETLTMKCGEEKALTPTINPSNADVKTLTWKSTDKSVATITSEGVLTAVSPGTATITCTATDDFKKSSSITVIVEPLDITITDKNPTIKEGTYREGGISYTRTLTKNKYTTFCMPYDVNLSDYTEYFSQVYVPMEMAFVKSGGKLMVMFKSVSLTETIRAGQPFIALASKSGTVAIKNGSKITITSLDEPMPTNLEVYNYGGNLLSRNTDVDVKITGNYFFVTDLDDANNFTFSVNGQMVSTTTVSPYRFYITKNDERSSAKITDILLSFDGEEATGVEDIINEQKGDDKFYNLNGQRINKTNAQKGVYIINGKKYTK